MSWQTLYYQYDDDALTLFANVGLLRRARKDVESNKVQLSDADLGVFISDGQQVKLDAQGLQKADCDCPASGCCKHILAAVLWLQNNKPVSSIAEQDTHIDSQASIEPASSSNSEINHQKQQQSASSPLLPNVLKLDPLALFKQVTKADCRLALQLVQKWFKSELIVEDLHTQLKMTLPESQDKVLFLRDGGFQGMLSELAEKKKKAFHLAAIAKLFLQNQQPWPWPDELIVNDNTALVLSDDEKSVINHIQQLIDDLLRQGLSHISQSSAAQLNLLSISARAEGLPRLAANLRSLSYHINLLANRHFTVSEGDVLRFIAQLSAYLYQLTHASTEQLPLLRGRGRRQYQDNDTETTLLLWPINARWWTTPTGALGATLSFWHSDEKQLIHCTQARPNNLDSTFNYHSIWHNQSIWKQTANQLMRNRFTLHAPRISEDDQLATTGDSYATCQTEMMTLNQYQQLKTEFGFDCWQQLHNYLSEQQLSALLTSQQNNQLEPVLLHIASYQQLVWNEVEQSLIWQVNDNQSNSTYLRLNWQDTHQRKFEELRYITKQNIEITAITVQPIRHTDAIQLEPQTVWLKTPQGIQLFYLDFDVNQRKRHKSGFINKIKEYMTQKQQKSTAFVSHRSLAQQLVSPILSVLETQACTGRQVLSDPQREQLQQSKQQLQDLGMLWLANQVERYLTASVQTHRQRLLCLVIACSTLEQLQIPLPISLQNTR